MSDFPIATYSVTIGRLKMPGMSADPNTWCVAGIRCRQAGSGEYLDLCFLPPGVALPANTSVGKLHISYRPITELVNYLDLLRNEAPVAMSLDSARPDQHYIHTANFEAVGEGE
jgi:hypothetical protein